MADNQISVQEALQITTRAIRQYTDDNTVLRSQAQDLDKEQKTIVKNNVGIYVQHTEPIDADDGDVWIDPDDTDADDVDDILEYINNQPVISYANNQNLGKVSRTVAKNNVGVYVSTNEPEGALDGDIWVDPDDDTNIVVVDKTLTKEGYAADAKSVGDALNALENALSALEELISNIGASGGGNIVMATAITDYAHTAEGESVTHASSTGIKEHINTAEDEAGNIATSASGSLYMEG